MKIIIPRWLYEKIVDEMGQERGDLYMAQWNAVAVDHWSEVDAPNDVGTEPVQPGTV